MKISPAVTSKYLPPSGPTNDGPTLPGMPAGERPRVVREPTFNLEYNVRQAGSSGVAKVELFGTRDGGRTWRSFGVDTDRRSPMQVRVKEEGIYGFRVVVTSRAGYGPRPPVSGDQPDQWVCVDSTRPTAQILSTQRGTGAESDQMTIAWQAEDQMLSARPVTISYSRNRGGPWMTVASGIENTQADTPGRPTIGCRRRSICDWKFVMRPATSACTTRLIRWRLPPRLHLPAWLLAVLRFSRPRRRKRRSRNLRLRRHSPTVHRWDSRSGLHKHAGQAPPLHFSVAKPPVSLSCSSP